MIDLPLEQRLEILADSAKYDVSCSSSGSSRSGKAGALGSTAASGICHTWTADGRCISLLKILLTNSCIYDCAYCLNRRSNDIPRAAMTPDEVVDLTMNFYRRNYIEGLFLSTGVIRSADYTMEQLIAVAERLRKVERFNGYIHLKLVPGIGVRSAQRIVQARRGTRLGEAELKKLGVVLKRAKYFLTAGGALSGWHQAGRAASDAALPDASALTGEL